MSQSKQGRHLQGKAVLKFATNAEVTVVLVGVARIAAETALSGSQDKGSVNVAPRPSQRAGGAPTHGSPGGRRLIGNFFLLPDTV